MGNFSGQVAWITGGGTGIGKALAVALAREGATVVVSGRRLDRLEGAVAAITEAGSTGRAVRCDVTDDASVEAAVAQIIEEFGQLHVVVANAGFAVGGKTTTLTPADWERQFSTNVFGVVRTVHHALPHLMQTGGRIGLIGSVAQYLPVPGSGAYSASKAAVHSFGNTLWTELKGTGVSVTLIHPGFIHSEIAQVDNSGTYKADRVDKRPSALMWTADAAARPMLRALYQRRRVAVITGHGVLGAFLGQRFPGLTARLMRMST